MIGRRTVFVGLVLVAIIVLAAALSALQIGGASSGPSRSPGVGSELKSAFTLSPGTDFSTYLGGVERDSNATGESTLNLTTAATLHQLWDLSVPGAFAAQAIDVNGTVYVGNWDGDELALNATTGHVYWQTYLGVDNASADCDASYGITSTATVTNGTLYVGGGNATFYALNASTGNVLWNYSTGNITKGFYVWASPLVYRGDVYVGIASKCDQPLVPAGLLEFSVATHAIVNFFNTTAPGVDGNSIWGSPAVNPATNTIYVATGNPARKGPRGLGESIIALNATTLALLHVWQVPVNQTVGDSDFGSTPTLIAPSGKPAIVVATNKNGITYAWYQSNLTLAWKYQVSSAVTVTSGCYGGGLLYVIGATTSINGTSTKSSVRAFQPETGAVVWQLALPNSMSGYVTPIYVGGALIVPSGAGFYVLNASSGSIISHYHVSGAILAPISISRGEIFVTTDYGYIYAFDSKVKAAAWYSTGSSTGSIQFDSSVIGGLPPYTIRWVFGDGGTSRLADPAHVYSTSGTYTVTVTATDQAGQKSSASLTVVIS